MTIAVYTVFLALVITGYQLIKNATRVRQPISKYKRFKMKIQRALKETPKKANENPLVKYLRQSLYQKEMQEELYDAILQLKNFSANQGNVYLSTDYTLTLLRRTSKRLRKVYDGVSSRVLEAQKEEDIKDYFKKQTGYNNAEDFIGIILKLDQLKPEEQREQIIGLQETMQQERITLKEKENQIKSDVAYTLITICFMAIGMNFLKVALWQQLTTNIG